MKFKLVTLLLVVIMIPCFVYANDQDIVGVGGSLKILNGEHHSVQMVSEIVTMDIYPTYYDVKASFIFQNHGKAVSVKMGFPETGHGGIDVDAAKTTPGFINFKTYVDGKPVPVKRLMVLANEDYEEYEADWVKEVSFKANQQRQVDVIYRSKIGNIAMPGLFAEYDFTGGNWYGKVKESQFVATLHLPATYQVFYDDEYGTLFYGPKETKFQLTTKGNRLFFSQKNWKAEGYIEILIKKPFIQEPVDDSNSAQPSNILPQPPQNLLSLEYAKYFNQYPGGQELPPTEQTQQILKANSLSDEGLALYKTKNDPLAIKKYEEALHYYASPEIYYRYGNSLSNIPRLEDAIKAYQIAIDLQYDKPYLAYYNIACTYSRMHNSKDSFSYLELAITNGYQNFEHIQKDDDLAFLRSQPEWNEWWEKHKRP